MLKMCRLTDREIESQIETQTDGTIAREIHNEKKRDNIYLYCKSCKGYPVYIMYLLRLRRRKRIAWV